MEKFRLISMSDFVEQIEKNSYTKTEKYNIIEWQSKCEAFDKIIKYAKFLNKPLTLGMFVPCDDDGNVLSKPSKDMLDKFINSEFGSFDESYTYCFNYQEAESKVIFKDFSFNKETENYYFLFKDGIYQHTLSKKCITIIESLVHYDLDLFVSF